MLAVAISLAMLPATLLASPALLNAQNVFAPPAPPSTLEKATIEVANALPVDAAITLKHWRGFNESTLQKLESDYVKPSSSTPGISVTFDTVRRDWDLWQVGIKFRNPKWTIWTDPWIQSLGINDINKKVSFGLIGHEVFSILEDRPESTAFQNRGDDFPRDATGLNSFVFVKAQNDFTESVSVNVELMTRSNTLVQKQLFTQKGGEISKAPLPFFFESNSTKEYVDLWSFTLSRGAGRPLTSKENRCELVPVDSGAVRTVSFSQNGWAIGGVKDVRCKGKWDPQGRGIEG